MGADTHSTAVPTNSEPTLPTDDVHGFRIESVVHKSGCDYALEDQDGDVWFYRDGLTKSEVGGCFGSWDGTLNDLIEALIDFADYETTDIGARLDEIEARISGLEETVEELKGSEQPEMDDELWYKFSDGGYDKFSRSNESAVIVNDEGAMNRTVVSNNMYGSDGQENSGWGVDSTIPMPYRGEYNEAWNVRNLETLRESDLPFTP
ncbi:hypothetical protein [Natrinema sp. DC36]|uniref:hypothetical protein n=1 Tax=Natrinema sp. DC36 TaxID=2878680 RepID=UPI001CF071B1|nr:hypothetical protein [Natrinema sp. DC36]